MFAGLVQRAVFASPAVVAAGGGGPAATTLSPTTGIDKNSGITLSNGNLTALDSVGDFSTWRGVRATQATAQSKCYVGVNVSEVNAAFDKMIGFDDGTPNFNSGSMLPGEANSNGVIIKLSNNGWYMASASNANNAIDNGQPAGYWAANTKVRVEKDDTTNTVRLYRSGILVGTLTGVTGLSGFNRLFVGSPNGDQMTVSFDGTMSGIGTPTAGFSPYG